MLNFLPNINDRLLKFWGTTVRLRDVP